MRKILFLIVFFQLIFCQNLISQDSWITAKDGNKIILLRPSRPSLIALAIGPRKE